MMLCALVTRGRGSVLEQEARCVINGQCIHPLQRLEPERVDWVTSSPHGFVL